MTCKRVTPPDCGKTGITLCNIKLTGTLTHKKVQVDWVELTSPRYGADCHITVAAWSKRTALYGFAICPSL